MLSCSSSESQLSGLLHVGNALHAGTRWPLADVCAWNKLNQLNQRRLCATLGAPGTSWGDAIYPSLGLLLRDPELIFLISWPQAHDPWCNPCPYRRPWNASGKAISVTKPPDSPPTKQFQFLHTESHVLFTLGQWKEGSGCTRTRLAIGPNSLEGNRLLQSV